MSPSTSAAASLPSFDPTDHSHRRWSASSHAELTELMARHADPDLTYLSPLLSLRPAQARMGALLSCTGLPSSKPPFMLQLTLPSACMRAAHRTKRPWQGQTEPPDYTVLPEYDPKCYLCPGNKRMGEDHNPKYETTFAFEVCSPRPSCE